MEFSFLLTKQCILLNFLLLVLMLPRCCSDKADYGSAQLNSSDKDDETGPDSKKLSQDYSYDPNFVAPNFGPVTAVCVDKLNNLHVMYRRSRIWDASTFDGQNRFVDIQQGPIKEDVIYTLDRETGAVLKAWGKNFFYLPHGLTVDENNNAFVTDVAMHQVFKFALNVSTEHPVLTLGEAFKPGQRNRFCKPTSVAVLADGTFFVADGYCNSRIVQYTKEGNYLRHWGESSISGEAVHPAPEGKFFIPHALTLIQEANKVPLLCVADRENGRVQCFNANTQTFVTQFHNPIIGARIFSVAYAKNKLFVVNGPEYTNNDVSGYVIDVDTAKVTSKFDIDDAKGGLANPHDLSVTPDAMEIFVAELDPQRLVKFVYTNGTNKVIRKNIASILQRDENGITIQHDATLILVTAMVFSFCIMAAGIVVLNMKRRRSRGCFQESRKSHGWERPKSKRGQQFKLSNILNRKEGFLELDQEASDDEHTSSSSGKLLGKKSESPLLSEELA
ncbi:peptidyl-alpha-hydroxyglycine alpha-amidating lyase 1 isoform X2 [Culicoides brevitarsis]|uniref:peptidyl-alpha-hydroxyglycine alpha-amidating lyase 1 isoform X2 n=1 Tax=Culicoides brevitarsis TaxID=469753 RepID=UPI00307B4E95